MRPLILVAALAAFARPTLAEMIVYVSLAGENKIAAYRQDASSGELARIGDTKTSGAPGALTTEPRRRFLFAALRSTGELASFEIDSKTGQLTLISSIPAGADPAYVACDRDGRYLLSAYYVAGKVEVHAIGQDGSLSEKPVQSIRTAEKAHAIMTDPTNRFVFVPHTGPNRIYQFKFDAQSGKLTPNDPPFIRTPENTGPRHVAFHPFTPVVYFDNEQGSSVTSYEMHAHDGTLFPFETFPTKPFTNAENNSCARLEITPDGRFLFASNRGHDSLAGFAVDRKTGRLRALGQTPTEKTPRSFNIDPSGRFLYAAGQASDKLAASRLHGDGRLERFATYEVGKTPWWVLAVRMADE